MKAIVSSIFLVISIVSCNRPPKDVRMVLDAAGDNRKEQGKVIDHYKSIGNKEKLKAAYFLIGNMDDKFSLDIDVARKYDPLFNFFGSLRQRGIPVKNLPFVKAAWDSLVSVLGPFKADDTEWIPDYKKMKAEYLIDNIDLAFATRDSSPWGHKISFEQFCEYVLSYRFRDEPLENWRSFYHDKYRSMLDTLQVDSCFKLASRMHKYVPTLWSLILFRNYPFDFSINQMENARIGTCDNVAIFRAMVLRAAGIPVA